MKIKWSLLFITLALLLSACGGSPAATAEAPVMPAPGDQPAEAPAAAPQDILGAWVLDPTQSTFGTSAEMSPLYTPLEAEIFGAGGVEITETYMVFGDFGHTYSWMDNQRIRLNGIVIGFGSVTDGFFAVFTVQREGDSLRLLTSDGSPFAVFRRSGNLP